MKIAILLVLFSVFISFWGFADTEQTVRDDLTRNDLERVRSVTSVTKIFSKAEKFELNSAGKSTSAKLVNTDAFSHPSGNLSFEEQQDFAVGNGLFRKLWVASPSSTQASDGLGPLFNARSCQRCHLKDGRGHPPVHAMDNATSLLIRLSVPPRNEQEQEQLDSGQRVAIPEPVYGGQLQDFAVAGLKSEGRIEIEYEEITIELAGGETATVRKPAYSIADLSYGNLHPDVMLSPRIAPQMIGLGLLEAIHPADIFARADPHDADRDGITGRVSRVRNAITGKYEIGRFGWKASKPTVGAQTAAAFSGDIGISSPGAKNPWGDCTRKQTDCLAMPTGVQKRLGETEAPDPVLELVAHYASNLAVPRRRDVGDPVVLHGKKLFYDAGCASCHTPKFVTRRDAERPEHRFQLIWPYTDMLLHDMGEGLADNRPAGSASGREWRTPPLWGIGLTQVVSGHTFFLHDGRARNLLEAVLWHGGEARAARESVVAMQPQERAALIRFLESL